MFSSIMNVELLIPKGGEEPIDVSSRRSYDKFS